jgi:hypothetical protein
MSLCTLLHWKPPPMQDPTFAFEHSQAHARLLGIMSPLTRFTVVPYILSPGANNSDMWHRNHQQAHSDSIDTIPGYFGGTGFGSFFHGPHPPHPIPTPPAGPVTQLGPAYNIEDYDLSDVPQRIWWTFQNHIAHLDAEQTQDQTLRGFIFPFL